MDQTLSKINGSTWIDLHGYLANEIICGKKSGSRTFSMFRGANPLDFSFTVLLLEMSIVLILSHIMRFLLKPLKQPKVISEILTGIMIGPSVLGQNSTFAKNVTPENTQFIIQNIGVMGFMFFLFVIGVKVDLSVIHKTEKKHWVIAFVGNVIPIIILWSVAFFMRDYMIQDRNKQFFYIGNITSAMIITSFPVIYFILGEKQLLSSEIGRVVLTTVIISDFVGIFVIVAFEAVKQGEGKIINVLYYVITILGFSTLIVNGIPQVMQRINKQTLEGKPVEKIYIIVTLLGIFVNGFITDFIGAAIGNGPLWLGLAIPDGPPIGAIIVNKTEVIMNDILMPFAYATIGLKTNVFAMTECWSCLSPIFALSLMAILAKLVAVVMVARFLDMSYRDSFTMSFMLNLRGQTEFFLYLHWVDLKILQTSTFSMMVILTIIVTGILSPIIDFLYNPTKPYMINKKRTIQHTEQESELRILACIYDQESVDSLFSFLDFVNPTKRNPFKVFALYLIELLGRGAPMFIDHRNPHNIYWDNNNEAIHNAIKLYEESRTDCVNMNFFTSVTPHRTMYQDICEIALSNKVGFIILPFHKICIENGNDFSTAIVRPGVQSANANTLSHAPCSVGILASKNAFTWGTFPTRVSHRIHSQIAILFLGGPDAREALSLAGHMVEHSDVSLIVVRFLASEYKKDDVLERRMDDGAVTSFWVKNERNDKVVYKEVVVSNGSETISFVQSLNHSVTVDLWIIGRKNGINPTLLKGLSEWSKNTELGLVGDFLVSVDFDTPGSVLVVQQQVLRDQQASH